jgi:flagellar biosynthetic protein FlhB
MAEDSADKTEEPTARKLQRSREEGQIARSVELTSAAVMIGAVLSFFVLGRFWWQEISAKFAAGFTFDRKALDTPALLPHIFSTQLVDAFLLFMPMMLLALVLAVLASGAIGGYLFAVKSVAPKFSKLSPLAGLKRMLGTHALVELLKAVFKFVLVGVILLVLLDKHFAALIGMGNMSLQPAFELAGSLMLEALIWLTFGLVLIALVDAPYQRLTFMKRMRMTKQEIRDEHKDMEGRPEVKAQIKRRQREIATAQMMRKVKDADVIITNPEHFAVALSYDPTADGAPLLLAKGGDFVAARIREEAKIHGIEIFEAAPLARALYFTTEIDQPIPESLYFAVAQVIAYVFSLANVQPGVDPMARPSPSIPKSMVFDSSGKQLSPEPATS